LLKTSVAMARPTALIAGEIASKTGLIVVVTVSIVGLPAGRTRIAGTITRFACEGAA